MRRVGSTIAMHGTYLPLPSFFLWLKSAMQFSSFKEFPPSWSNEILAAAGQVKKVSENLAVPVPISKVQKHP
jgi:hypothetical protein